MSQASLLVYLPGVVSLLSCLLVMKHMVYSRRGVPHYRASDVLKVVDIYQVWVNYGFVCIVYKQ
jgi:hypothetical protein